MIARANRIQPPRSSEDRLGTIDPVADTGDEDKLSNRDVVTSLSRGLEVLASFSRTRRKMTLSEVATVTGMNRATVRRFLLTLIKDGYVVSDGKVFDLTPKVLDLGFSVLSTIGIWDRARPFMERLSSDTGESCTAAILDGNQVVYVAGVQAHNIISVGIMVGSRQSAYYTANGRVLLAAQPENYWDGIIQTADLAGPTPRSITDKAEFRRVLEQVRDQGWCLVDQELELGLLSLAIPLRYRSGTLAGSMNIAVPSVRGDAETLVERHLPRLQEVAEQIRLALAH